MTQAKYDKLNWLSRIFFPKLTVLLAAIGTAFTVYGNDSIGIWFNIASAISAAVDAFLSAIVSNESMAFFKEANIVQVDDPIEELKDEEVVG